MKKLLSITFVLFCFSNMMYSQGNLEKFFKSIIDGLKEESYQIANVASQTITINSTTNEVFGGKSKDVFKFTLPEGTKKIAVRVTVIPVKSTYQYEEDETFYSLIKKGDAREVAAPQDLGINFYLLNRSYDADAFKNNQNFKALWIIEKVNSFVDSRVVDPGNYWIGVYNYNSINGLKAIVEVVALGKFN
jgi:hypothetical protein